MSEDQSVAGGAAQPFEMPAVRKIGRADLMDALAKGFADFVAMPTHLIFLPQIYIVMALVFARVYAGHDVLPLVFPLIAGFTLIGPLVATGMYELSRRREAGLDTSRIHAFTVVKSPAMLKIAMLGGVQLGIYVVWILIARVLHFILFGGEDPESMMGFVDQMTTGAGLTMAIVGSGIGGLFAVAVLVISVVSFPLILDRNCDPVIAVGTSARACLANPIPMLMWGVIVSVALLIGSIPLFVGLAVVMPVLGHSTWHLYRAVVVR